MVSLPPAAATAVTDGELVGGRSEHGHRRPRGRAPEPPETVGFTGLQLRFIDLFLCLVAQPKLPGGWRIPI